MEPFLTAEKGLLQNSCYIQNMVFRALESHPYIVYRLHFATALTIYVPLWLHHKVHQPSRNVNFLHHCPCQLVLYRLFAYGNGVFLADIACHL